MSAAPSPWPELPFDEIRPTAEYLHRLAQIGGKYTLGEPFEPNWGNVLMPVTPRGFATPTLFADGVFFTVEYELLDDRVTISASTGRASVPLEPGSVAGFYARFADAAGTLGIPPLPNTLQPEIQGAPPLDEDTEERPYDPEVARRIWSAFAHVQNALLDYQAPFAGYRPRTGLMWGGFDLSASRFSGRAVTPPDSHPTFLRNGMTGEVVAVGFVLGDEMHSPEPAFYAYISPLPDGLEEASFGVRDASWDPGSGLIVLPYDAVRESEDPHATVVRFADAVWGVACERGGFPADLAGKRVEGWYATRHPVFS
jgi:hypothetical protein